MVVLRLKALYVEVLSIYISYLFHRGMLSFFLTSISAEQAVLLAYYEQIFAFTVGPSHSALYASLRDSSEIFLISSPAVNHPPCGILKTFKLGQAHSKALPVRQDVQVAEGSSIQYLATPAADYVIVVNTHAGSSCSKEAPALGILGKRTRTRFTTDQIAY